MKQEYPLVSVPVVTYNSSKTILETLESIKAQTYPNIELIISDDCSKDDTVEICRHWIDYNRNRFVRTELLIVEHNTGVAENLNRAEIACKSEWVKGIAGDDILLPNCIQDCVDYVAEHPDTIYLFGRMEGFGRPKEEVDEYMNRCFDYSFFDLSAKEQYHRLVFQGNCVPAPTLFHNRVRVSELGITNDERIPMVEDYPKWMSITKRGIQLRFVDKVLVKYRLSESSISTTTTPSLRAKQSSALIYIYYQFGPRIKSFKSPIKKIGEIRKYIHAANTAWGGWFWKSAKAVDWCMAKVLNMFGAKLKV
jgi:alpha-1,3-rhamnosyltransferase